MIVSRLFVATSLLAAQDGNVIVANDGQMTARAQSRLR
jgi:hypothetical protein